jgi:hypothetical protein
MDVVHLAVVRIKPVQQSKEYPLLCWIQNGQCVFHPGHHRKRSEKVLSASGTDVDEGRSPVFRMLLF